VLVVVLCAAMTGLTYAVVALSKESRVGDNGVMVVKGSDTPVSTGGSCRGIIGTQPRSVFQARARLSSFATVVRQPRRPGDDDC
jgi:hypothetical protein